MSNSATKYIDKYNKANYKMYQFRVKKNNDKIINFLDSIDNRNNYIISLINQDKFSSILTIKEIKETIKPILNNFGIKEIYLFGSYARGEANSKSDVDIFCEKGNIKTFIDQGILEEQLENALKKKVDIIFIGSEMNDYFRKQIMEDLIKLC